MILSSSERGRDRAAWGLLVRRAAPRAMTRAGTRHCGAEAGAEAPLTLSGFPPGQCRAAPGSREGGFPPPVLHPLTVPGDPRGQQHEAQRKTKMPDLLLKNQGGKCSFSPFFVFFLFFDHDVSLNVSPPRYCKSRWRKSENFKSLVSASPFIFLS